MWAGDSDDGTSGQSAELEVLNDKRITALVAYPNQCLVSGHANGDIRIWYDGKAANIPAGHTKKITSLAVFRNDRLLSASLDNTIKIWDERGICKNTITLFPTTISIKRLAASQNNTWFAALVDQQYIGSIIYIWYADGTCSQHPQLKAKKDSPLISAENKLIYIDPDDNIVIYDVNNKKEITKIKLSLNTAVTLGAIATFDFNCLVYGTNTYEITASQCGAAVHRSFRINLFDLNSNLQIQQFEKIGFQLKSLITLPQKNGKLIAFCENAYANHYCYLDHTMLTTPTYVHLNYDSLIGIVCVDDKNIAYVTHDDSTQTSEIKFIPYAQ